MLAAKVTHAEPSLVDIDDVLGFVVHGQECHGPSLSQYEGPVRIALHANLVYPLVP